MLNYDEVTEAVRERLETALGVPVFVGALPPNGGMALTVNSGTVQRDMAGNAFCRLRIGVNAKAAGQPDVVQAMGEAHAALIDMTAETKDWQLTGISVTSAPAVATLDAAGNYITMSQTEVRVTFWA